uniref:Flavin-containing monooxygenase n=1 Tax=Hippocampus comes TaxID=109280 RepID=A0A3Q2Z6S6_HIPCM
MALTVAVIGAGPSGLTSVKSCLDEGLKPTCFESGPDIGGLWRFKEEPEPGRANIYQSVIINTSKEMMTFSDLPPPAHLPNNMHHSEVLLYLRLYAQSFNLLKHIRFKVGASQTRQAKSEIKKDWVNFEVVCTLQPPVVFHSWEYRSPEGLQGKRVIVVGMGNSGSDIAVDISPVAEKVYLSTRSGAWVVGRVGPGGLPRDLIGNSRIDGLKRKLFLSRVNQMTEKKLNRYFDHRLYGIKPKHSFYAQIPVVNDDLPSRIISGRVEVKPNLKCFSGSDAIFDDGTIVHKVDVVVFATGYNYSFPFLPPDLQGKCGPGPLHRLYRHVFALGLTSPTLAVVGLIDGLGAVNLLAELQARWATRVFKGLISLPTQEAMMEDIKRERAKRCKRFTDGKKNPLLVDVLPYMDSLAVEAGLAWHVLLGPCTPYQYRLIGPGKWDGARRAILTQWERVHQPFRSRQAESGLPTAMISYGLIGLLTGATILTFCFYKNLHLNMSCFFS